MERFWQHDWTNWSTDMFLVCICGQILSRWISTCIYCLISKLLSLGNLLNRLEEERDGTGSTGSKVKCIAPDFQFSNSWDAVVEKKTVKGITLHQMGGTRYY